MKKIVFILVFLLGLGLGSAQARVEAVTYPKFSFGVVFGTYYPDCQEWNRYLEQINSAWDMNLVLERGNVYGLSGAVDLTPNFRIRGELTNCKIETAETGERSGGYWSWWWYHSWEETLDFEAELGITSLMISGIYKLPSYVSSSNIVMTPYFGAGIGQLIATGKMFAEYQYDEYIDSYWYDHDEWKLSDGDSGSSIGVQILGGIETEVSQYLTFAVEGKYVVSPETELKFDEFGQRFRVNLGGLYLQFLLNLKI